MSANFILFLSFIGIAIHLYMEARFFVSWNEAKEFFPTSGYFEKVPLNISCFGITAIYGLIVFLEIYFKNDFSKTLTLGAQGAIFFNFLIHFFLKFIWKKNMPCFWSSFLFGLLPCIVLTQLAYSTSWFSTFLIIQIFLYGMLIDALLIIFSLFIASSFFPKQTKENVNSWEEF